MSQKYTHFFVSDPRQVETFLKLGPLDPPRNPHRQQYERPWGRKGNPPGVSWGTFSLVSAVSEGS